VRIRHQLSTFLNYWDQEAGPYYNGNLITDTSCTTQAGNPGIQLKRLQSSIVHVTTGTAIAVGRARRVHIAPLREINLPPIRPFNNAVSHMQILGVSERVHTPHVSWPKASELDLCKYGSVLDLKLRGIIITTEALLCNNLTCTQVEHLRSIHVFAGELSEACISLDDVSIPFTCDRKIAGRLPGWSERVQPLRVKSLFWHRMWVDCGRPRDGAVADVMQRTRAAYHYAIRQTRQEENTIIRDRVAASLLEDGQCYFGQEIKRIRGNKAVSSTMVNGLTDTGDIANLFASRYHDLYTSVPYNIDEMQVILNLNGIDSSLAGVSISKDCF